jgi:hypothetical protein
MPVRHVRGSFAGPREVRHQVTVKPAGGVNLEQRCHGAAADRSPLVGMRTGRSCRSRLDSFIACSVVRPDVAHRLFPGAGVQVPSPEVHNAAPSNARISVPWQRLPCRCITAAGVRYQPELARSKRRADTGGAAIVLAPRWRLFPVLQQAIPNCSSTAGRLRGGFCRVRHRCYHHDAGGNECRAIGRSLFRRGRWCGRLRNVRSRRWDGISGRRHYGRLRSHHGHRSFRRGDDDDRPWVCSGSVVGAGGRHTEANDKKHSRR